MSKIENKTYDELNVGDKATFEKSCTDKDIVLMAACSGDANPVHLDESFAADTQFGTRIAHGIWTGSLVSAAVGMRLPGPGTIYLRQEFNFKRPVKMGDHLTASVEVAEKREKNNVLLNVAVVNQKGKIVLDGTSLVIAPTEKVIADIPTIPEITIAQ